ncbi:MAG: hypothetical protein Q9159_003371 [Coniocarpon cinnabarinum]
MSLQDGTTNPNDPQEQDMFDFGDGTQLNDFDASLLGNDVDFGNLGDDPNSMFPTSLEPTLSPQDPSQLQNIPQPSVELSQPTGQRQFADTQSTAEDQHEAQDVSMSGVGAGPLPTGFGVQLPANAGSTLTDFTKRRNWSARVVEEIKDFLHILTPDGRIMYVSPSAKPLTGHETSQLVGKFMTSFVHPDDNSMYVREFNESIASGNPLRFFFRFRKADDSYGIFESHGHPHFSSDVSNLGGSSHSLGFCRGFFMMARPYPTKNSALLDSFLEHKIESERLKKRITDLKREEQEELHQQYMSPSAPSASMPPKQVSHASVSPSDAAAAAQYQHQRHPSSGDANVPSSPHTYSAMPPPAKPPVSNFALTQRNLGEAAAASRPDSINDKMMRYEGANHIEGIEMLTGLRYREGERSKGISTGAMSPMLVRGDQGIEIPPNPTRNGRDVERHSDSPLGGESDKKKKMKVTDEYVCTDCGTLDSPEWRRGPNGPKTLCNACGLRWAKQEKKRTGQGSVPNGATNSGGTPGVGGTKPSPMVPGAGGGGAAPGGQASAGMQQGQEDPLSPGGDAGSRVNNGATQQSGGRVVPAAGSSANVPGPIMSQGTAGDMRSPMAGSQPPAHPSSMSGHPSHNAHSTHSAPNVPMDAPNPMLNAGGMGMQGAISGNNNTPGGAVSGVNPVDFSGGQGGMTDMMDFMNGFATHGSQQPQSRGFGDPGGGGGPGQGR